MTALVMLIVFLQFSRANKLITESSPLYIAIEHIKLETTLAHLFFEEILAGDNSETIQSTRSYLHSAQSYIKALLSGGNVKGLAIPQLKSIHPELHIAALNLDRSLQNLIRLLENRYVIAEDASSGSVLDNEFDSVFFEFLALAESLESDLFTHYQALSNQYLRVSKIILVVSFFTMLAYIGHLYCDHKHLSNQIQRVTIAKQETETENRQLSFMALHDSLTHLPNRNHFEQQIAFRLEQAALNKLKLALIFIDIDDFKKVNDALGHQAGDELLVEFANRLRMAIRANDFVARFAGDEFVVILGPGNDPNQIEEQAAQVIERIQKLISQRFQLAEESKQIRASLGIALYPEDATTFMQLIKHADLDMYQAKQLSRHNRIVYESTEETPSV